ncbi:unnamed protein product [Peronospora belbahrii]|uniref:Uncharacterized protein n=1 Tax=Peronospora belbahrii TaxID=622444 RepID=A0ABN8CPB7_9STRA|nr:unnamed protein product [Peronospora belbahrii]
MIEEMVEERTVEAIPTELHHNSIRCFRFWAQFVGEQRTTSDSASYYRVHCQEVRESKGMFAIRCGLVDRSTLISW